MARKGPTITLAEGWRAHREAFELALKLNITPAEARHILDTRAARARAAEIERRLAAKQHAPLRAAHPRTREVPRTTPDQPEPPTLFWWHN
jgi:hypothetical protein